jgi:citrate lyase gamma subunit
LDLNDIEVDDNGALDGTDLKARIDAPVVAVDNLS